MTHPVVNQRSRQRARRAGDSSGQLNSLVAWTVGVAAHDLATRAVAELALTTRVGEHRFGLSNDGRDSLLN